MVAMLKRSLLSERINICNTFGGCPPGIKALTLVFAVVLSSKRVLGYSITTGGTVFSHSYHSVDCLIKVLNTT
jgi:hypothetical protein